MSWRQKPVGAELLRLSGPWIDGVTIAAGRCLLSPGPAPARTLLGEPCGISGCQSIICGTTPEDLEQHGVDHRRRCHQ